MATSKNIGIEGAHARTIFAVIKLSAFVSYQVLVGFGAAPPSGGLFSLTTEGSAAPGSYYFSGGSADVKGGTTDLSWHIHTVSFDGTKVSWRVDGVLLPSFPAALPLDTSASPLRLAAVADYAEVIVVDRLVGVTEDTAIVKYLTGKYAIY